VLGAFALLIAAMALSMFGVYQLQVPAALQTRNWPMLPAARLPASWPACSSWARSRP
jgi:hypothetical protein